MYFKRLLYSLIVTVLVSGFIFAQDSPTDSQAEKDKAQAEKEKKAVALIEEIAGQISFLKNPDNRSLTFASVADLLWKRDEKRARQLFRQSADEIVAGNNAPPETATIETMMFFGRNSSPRADILRTIAARDAELALELLYVTRPANIAAALTSYNRSQPKTSAPKNPADSMQQQQNRSIAEMELRLEQSFSEKAAESDPQLAAKMLRESLGKNGVTSSAFSILQKINSKDHELAIKLLNEVNQKLIGESYDGENDKSSLGIQFLKQFYLDADKNALKDKETKLLKLEAAAAKELANKIVDGFLKTDSTRSMSLYFQLRSAMTTLEKIIPERAALLKQKQSEIKKSLPEEMTRFDDVFTGDDNPAPEKMVSNAAKMLAQMRGFMYRNAVNEAVKNGNTDAVRASLNQAPEGKERDDAIAYLDSKIAEKKIKDGNVDEARKIIDSLSSTKEKVERLVQMAISFQQKNSKEDKEFAAKLMTEARSLIDYSPEDEDAANDYLRIVSGYAYVEPATAFSMLDSFADQVNELVNASATVAKFDKNNPNFKNGELIMTRGLPRIGGKVLSYGKEAQLLANEDIDRLKNIAGKFQRPDAQILLKIYIVQAFFTGKIGLQGASGGDRENSFVFSFGD
ncbi:MAG: hypothetical protein ABIP06_00390 [Pyrinomonadaceae bacterium]